MANAKNAKIHSLPTDRDFYPSSDGKPMAETDMHRGLLLDAVFMLKNHFRNREDVYVSADLLLYYEEGNPEKSVVPDVFVVFGIEKKRRDNYLLWEEGKGPDFVLELSHKDTYDYDLGEKMRIYAEELGVTEYFLYDPDHNLEPPFQGYRLTHGVYNPIQLVNEQFQSWWMRSGVLGLEIGLKTRELDFYNPQSGVHLLARKESNQRYREQELKAQLQKEIYARQLAEARAKEAEAALTRLQSEIKQMWIEIAQLQTQ